MKAKCYSVRLLSLVSISEKAYKATAFDGSTAIIPKSQVFGEDCEVQKSDAYWVSAWILERKTLQYSCKKPAYFNPKTGEIFRCVITRHTPEKMQPVENNIIRELEIG